MTGSDRLPAALLQVARETFGIERLHDAQRRVIARVLAGEDTLALMPSGGGKSLCYQLPALMLEGCTVVVSPLIALMKDQVDKLRSAGIETAQFNSALPASEQRSDAEALVEGRRAIVFATPERLADAAFLGLLKQQRIALFVVDEAHCISQWGHDFRPAFLEIGPALRALADPPVLALTATASDAVVEDIRLQLGRPRLQVVDGGSYRANLALQVAQATSEAEKLDRLRDALRRAQGAGIVYCSTVRACVALHQQLEAAGESCTLYHGQLRAAERHANQDRFMRGDVRMIVATSAFGMGIDKPDIRFVLHYQLPGSLAAYYQEAGRAGRDGAKADCALLYWRGDRQVQQFFLARRYPDAQDLARIHQVLAGGAALAAPILAGRLPGLPRNRLAVALKLLRDGGWLRSDRHRAWHTAPGRGPRARDFETLAAAYREKDERDREALERMVFYAQTGFCRWRVLLEQFSESPPGGACGHCDNCLRPPPEPAAAPPAAAVPPRRSAHFAVGDAVRVPRYGEGRVSSVGDDELGVQFPDGSERRFVARYVRRAATGGRARGLPRDPLVP